MTFDPLPVFVENHPKAATIKSGGHFVLWHSKKYTYCTFKTFLVFWIEVSASDDQSEALLELIKQNKENKA